MSKCNMYVKNLLQVISIRKNTNFKYHNLKIYIC